MVLKPRLPIPRLATQLIVMMMNYVDEHLKKQLQNGISLLNTYSTEKANAIKYHLRKVILYIFTYSLLHPFLCFTTNQFAQKFEFLANLITHFVNIYNIYQVNDFK